MNASMRVIVLGACLCVTGAARAQSINVDFGLPADAPSATYAAAGLPGVWNSIEGQAIPRVDYPIVGLDGAPTGVTIYQYGGMDLLSLDDPSVSGDDAALLNDALVTYTPSLESCLFVNGLEPGTYEVIMYAWMPNAPTVGARVRHDPSPVTVDVRGAWTGAHVEGVTYARHVLEVGADGLLGSHSGIVPGELATAGAALNGFQLRKLVPGADAGIPPRPDAGAVARPDAGPAPRADAGTSAPFDAGSVAPDAGGGTPPAADDGGCAVARRGTAGASVLGTAALAAVLVMLRGIRRRSGSTYRSASSRTPR